MMNYLPEESKVLYESKEGKEEKVFNALEWLAVIGSRIPEKKRINVGVLKVLLYAIPKKLTFILQHDYVRSNGFADFTYLLGTNPLPAGTTQDNIDISNWDDYRLRSYLIKAKYYATKNFAFSVGYAYERFKYNDAQIDGYQFVPATTGSNGAYLTGAYRSPSYSASIVFLGATYQF
jgi:hypothetical protein